MSKKQASRIFRHEAETTLKTKYGDFRFIAYQSSVDYSIHLCLVKGDVSNKSKVLCRIHSSCVTGDILHSSHCDCGYQLAATMKRIAQKGEGLILYLYQEGRGINIINKIKAYQLQWGGLDTVEANRALDLPDDLRDYGVVADVLSDLNIRSITLLTNNPDKIVKLRDLGVLVEGTEPLVAGYNNFNQRYLNTKRDKMSHIINAPVYIALGTTSADKLKYFKGVAKSRLCYKDIVSIEVESGVSDQPIGLYEIQTGADNRARLAFESSGLFNKIGVGLEGGLIEEGDNLYLLCIASVYDGGYYRGVSQKIVLPSDVAQRIKKGGQFGIEIRRYQPKPEERNRVNELVSREESFKKAIIQAIQMYLLSNNGLSKN